MTEAGLFQVHADALAEVDGGDLGLACDPRVLEDLVCVVALDGVDDKHV